MKDIGKGLLFLAIYGMAICVLVAFMYTFVTKIEMIVSITLLVMGVSIVGCAVWFLIVYIKNGFKLWDEKDYVDYDVDYEKDRYAP